MKKLNGKAGRVSALALCGAVLIAASLSACGSSKSGTTAPTTGAATASPTTGTATSSKSYAVMVATDITSTVSFSAPETVTGAEGALAGDKGVRVIPCDTQSTATASQNCAHEAVADHVAAVILGFTDLTEDEGILTQAGIPAIGVTDATSPNSFAITNSAGGYGGIGVGLSQAGCHRLGILYLDGTDVLADAIVAGGKWQSITRAAIPITTPDISPDIAKLAEGKVQCVVISTFPNQVVQAMTAIKQDNLKVQVWMSTALLSPQLLKSLGPEANGVVGVEPTIDPTSNAPVVAQIKAAMKGINPKSPLTELSIIGWVSGELIQDAAQQINGPVTAASMLTALNGLRNVSTDGAIPPFSAIELPNPAYKRFFNHYDIDYVVKDGALQQLTNFYDVSSALGTKSL
jgi:Periplasmic binding protein